MEVLSALEIILRGVILAVNEILMRLEWVFIVAGEEMISVRAVVTSEVEMWVVMWISEIIMTMLLVATDYIYCYYLQHIQWYNLTQNNPYT